MKKYFYTNGSEKIGPFSFEELKKKNLSRDTRIWFYGLDKWTPLSEIDELKFLTNSIPPNLKEHLPIEMQKNNDSNIAIPGNKPIIRLSKNKRILKRGIIILIISFFVFLISFNVYNKHQKRVLYQKIVTSAYDTDVDFNFYVEKFYRDIGVYGIFPKKPNKIIIKFAKFDYIDNATHYHGISYGKDDDDRIEIYVNPSTWEKFNKPMRYFLMYHELAHDVLNLDDLEDTPINKGKLMYPAIASYESKTMDDFIESSHTLFKEVASKQKK